MAIDTAAKRLSVIAVRRLPWMRRFALPAPDSTIDSGDRQQTWEVYRGIAANAPVVTRGGSSGDAGEKAERREIAWPEPKRQPQPLAPWFDYEVVGEVVLRYAGEVAVEWLVPGAKPQPVVAPKKLGPPAPPVSPEPPPVFAHAVVAEFPFSISGSVRLNFFDPVLSVREDMRAIRMAADASDGADKVALLELLNVMGGRGK